MDSHIVFKLILILIGLSIIPLRIGAESEGTILFLDNAENSFFRKSGAATEANTLSASEVASAISILLGFAPPASLALSSSLKLNEILTPNPFDRPHAVFMLEINGVEDPFLWVDMPKSQFHRTLSSRVLFPSDNAKIVVEGEDGIIFIPLNDRLDLDCNVACSHNEFHELAKLLGVSYSGQIESLDSELSIPLPNGSPLTLHFSQKAHREFVSSLINIVHNIRKTAEMNRHISGGSHISVLLSGCFTGMQALQQQYGSRDIAQQGLQLLMITVGKLFDSLQDAYEGKIAGVILFNGGNVPYSDSMLDAKLLSRASRLLEEVRSSNSTTEAEVKLVRLSLAWVTGIILLISTLIGVYLLLNMPLTKDTLLYSNVKLD